MNAEPAASPTANHDRKSPVKITSAAAAHVIRLAAQGRPHREIAATVGISIRTVSRVLSRPATIQEVDDLARRLGVDRQACRERAKDFLAGKLGKTLEKVVDLVDSKADEGHARDVSHAAQALERLDRVSGNTVGEGQRIIHEGLPQQHNPRGELRVLIEQLRDADGGFSSFDESERRIAEQNGGQLPASHTPASEMKFLLNYLDKKLPPLPPDARGDTA